MADDVNVQNKLSEILAALNPARAQHPTPQSYPQPQQTFAQPAPAPAALTRPDPRTITTLPAAHRHITTHLLTDPTVAPAVRALRAWQHAKERHYFSERQVLLHRHTERAATEARLSALMGTKVALPAISAEQELKEFDRSVWVKTREMMGQMEKELARLGVPLFFEGVDYGDPVRLAEWRKRAVELLEDLCEDEVQ